ncbi:hypothetical protein AB0D46_19655 [Streptomyces sp. NPDC048383]
MTDMPVASLRASSGGGTSFDRTPTPERAPPRGRSGAGLEQVWSKS